jgi:hypothetical protein
MALQRPRRKLHGIMDVSRRQNTCQRDGKIVWVHVASNH